jgi:cytochrome c-type biogenesis protein
MNDAITAVLEHLSGLIQANFWLAPVRSLAAGLLTSVTPCSLSSVPLVVAYVGGSGRKEPAAAFRFSVVFAFGMAVTFTALGAGASLLGKLLNFGTGGWWYLALGGLMILMALQTWGIITIIPSTYAQRKNTRKGYLGALIMGVLGGLFSSPCATPVLIALLALVARSGNPVWGIFLLLLYSIGHSVLVIIAGTFMGVVGKLTKSGAYGMFSKVLNIVLGLAILLAGFYLIYTGL